MFNIYDTLDTKQLISLSRSNTPEAKIAMAQLLFRYEGILSHLVKRTASKMGVSIPHETSSDGRDHTNIHNDERYEDLKEVSRLALFEAIHYFDVNRGTEFSTYLWQFVLGRLKRSMIQEIEYERHLMTPVTDLNECDEDIDDEGDVYGFPLLYSDDDTSSIVIDRETSTEVDQFISTLNPRQRGIARRIYWGGMTQTEVAHHQGVSTNMVHKVLKQIKREGRQYFGSNPYV